MMRKISILLVCLLAVGMASHALAEIRGGSAEVSGYIGPLIGLDKAHYEGYPAGAELPEYGFVGIQEAGVDPNTGVFSGFRLGYNLTPYIGTEFSWGWSSANYEVFEKFVTGEEEILGKTKIDTSQFLFHTNIILHLLPESRIVPFLTTGIGLIHFSDNAKVFFQKDDPGTQFVPNWGGGVKMFLTESIILRGDLRFFNFSLGDNFKDRLTTLEVSGGLSYCFDLIK